MWLLLGLALTPPAPLTRCSSAELLPHYESGSWFRAFPCLGVPLEFVWDFLAWVSLCRCSLCRISPAVQSWPFPLSHCPFCSCCSTGATTGLCLLGLLQKQPPKAPWREKGQGGSRALLQEEFRTQGALTWTGTNWLNSGFV